MPDRRVTHLARLRVGLDRLLDGLIDPIVWLALPLLLLLFLQWPLRDLVHAYSTLANDLAQVFFAIYAATAVSCATRRGVHLASDVLAQRYAPGRRLWLRRAGALLALLPWALALLLPGARDIAAAVMISERFPETLNPGYFMVKLALGWLAVLTLLQVLRELLPAGRSASGP